MRWSGDVVKLGFAIVSKVFHLSFSVIIQMFGAIPPTSVLINWFGTSSALASILFFSTLFACVCVALIPTFDTQ